jgi:hypothetical protein
MSDRVLIIIPAHNEQQSIVDVIERLRSVVPKFERVVVNDGSTDLTGQLLADMGEKQLRLISNLGYGQALQTGLKYALARDFDVIVTMDADGQHQPKDVPRLVQALQESSADMIIGSRFSEGRPYNTPIGPRLGQLMFSHLTRHLLGHRIFDTSSGFKALRARTCEVIVDAAFMDFHIETIVKLSLANFKIIELPVDVLERTSGRSMHSIVSVFNYPLKTILLTMAAIMDAIVIRRAR